MNAQELLTKMRRIEVELHKADATIDARIAQVRAPVQKVIDEMLAELQPQIDAMELERLAARKSVIDKAGASPEELEQIARKAVLAEGHTISGELVDGMRIECRWSKGTISWDDKMLQGYATAGHPEIMGFRKTGEPKTSIYRVGENGK